VLEVMGESGPLHQMPLADHASVMAAAIKNSRQTRRVCVKLAVV